MAEISVIITTCKRKPEMLKRAVDSVLAQTFEDLEVIVVDDSPADFPLREEVKAMLESIEDSRVHYIQHEVNKGACAARNTGMAAATGKYYNFLDDDDEFMPQKLASQYAVLEEKKDVGLVSCKRLIINDATSKGEIERKITYNGMVFAQMMAGNFIPFGCALIRKECFVQVGGFNVELLSSQDYEMFLRITREFPIYVVEEVLFKSHLHEDGRISSNPHKKIQGTGMVIDLFKDYLLEHKRIYSLKLIELVKYHIWLKDHKKSQQLLKESCKMYPLNTLYNLAIVAYWKLKYR